MIQRLTGLAISLMIAVLLSACGASAQSNDKWDEWNSGQTSPEMSSVADSLGLGEIMLPVDNYAEQGAVGVSRFGGTCLVVFSNATGEGEDASDLLVSISLMSRYRDTDPQVFVLGPTNDPETMRASFTGFLARHQADCGQSA